MELVPAFIAARIHNRPALQKILGNTGWLLADKALRMGLGLLVGVWVARYLGPEQFGIYNYALAFVALFSPFAALGLDKIVVRDILLDSAGTAETLGTAFMLRICGALLTMIAAIYAILLIRPADNLTHWLVAILAASMTFQAFETIDFWFQSQVQSRYVVWARNAALVIVTLVKVGLIMTRSPLIAFAWACLAESGIAALGLVIAYRLKSQCIKAWRVSLRRARKFIESSWPLILSGIMSMLDMRIDMVMLGQMVGSESVGIYSAAVRLSEIWYFIPAIVGSSLFPAIVNSKQLGHDIYRERIQRYYDLNAALAYGLSIPTSLLAPFIISFLYGNAYSNSDVIFSIHIWACLFAFIGVARGNYLIADGLIKYSLFCNALGCSINIILNLVLIPKYEAVGAALATVISFAISGYLSSFIFPALRPAGLMQTKALLFPLRALFKSSGYASI